MTPSAEVLVGDALERLAELEDRTFDAMLTDPPYGLAFMGKRWDYDVPSVDLWREALRVLKPGAHALVACGTRTQHRMVCNLEDAGFEVRDVIAWLYGSGFPKSLDVSKAIDRELGADREAVGTATNWGTTRLEDGKRGYGDYAGEWSITAPGSPEGERWSGYGTALKPAMELWTLVRRPLEGTVARNALEHGVGGLNVEACRVAYASEDDRPTQEEWNRAGSSGSPGANGYAGQVSAGMKAAYSAGAIPVPSGRWPANVTHDGSPEVLERFPDAGGGYGRQGTGRGVVYAPMERPAGDVVGYGDAGSAARFFYCAKADTAERDAGLEHLEARERPATWGDLGAVDGNPRKPDTGHTTRLRNVHPTVKPLALTAWLATLIRPPERDTPRRLLVPFAGSGSEVIGGRLAGWEHVLGIELDPAYAEIARARILHHTNGRLW